VGVTRGRVRDVVVVRGAVVVGAVVVVAVVVVDATEVVVLTMGIDALCLLDDCCAAPAIAAMSNTRTTGTAILAHNGHDRIRARTDFGAGTAAIAGTATVGITAVSQSRAIGTA
jgi:hypothetical protein